MNTANTDLFGEERISIAGNQYLADICNHILNLIPEGSPLLTGKSIGEINRKVTLAVWEDSGLTPEVWKGGREAFHKWFMSKQVNQEEEIARALRYLTSHNIRHLPHDVIVKAEQHRQRIARSVR